MKVFLDTNVLTSAFAARGLCADLMRLVLAEHELQTGAVNLVELRHVLRDRFKASTPQIDRIVTLLSDQTIVAKPNALIAIKVRDGHDAWVLASAVAGGADMLVTGDKDLLVIAAKAPLPVVTPRDAGDRLRGTGRG